MTGTGPGGAYPKVAYGALSASKTSTIDDTGSKDEPYGV